MMSLRTSFLGVAAWALLLGACGPEAELAQPSNVGDLGRKLGASVATYGNTCAASNTWMTRCGSGLSRDISYTWAVPAAGRYSFSTQGSSLETVLEIRDYRDTAQVLGCTTEALAQRTSGLNLELASGQVLLITIEGVEAACGNALLNITRQ